MRSWTLLALLSIFALATASEAAPQAPQTQPHVVNAVDGIFAAFKRHPIILLGDAHSLAQEGSFYATVIRDPRFARDVRNLVVEFGGAADQDVIDRYTEGDVIPYTELRRVWTDLVGWEAPPTQMYSKVFATVRFVNAKLPPGKRIRIWLGEPPIDWKKLRSFDDLDPLMRERDSYPAELVNRRILAHGGKALIIYGSDHFLFNPFSNDLRRSIEVMHPGSTYLVLPYRGYQRPGCSAEFEAHAQAWPTPALVSPVVGTWLEAMMTRCADPLEFHSPDLAANARAKSALSGTSADARLYIGPVSSLTEDLADQSLYLDPRYVDEWNRTRACCLPPRVGTIDSEKVLRGDASTPKTYVEHES